MLCLVPAWERIPVAGYVAALGLIGAAAMLVPQTTAAGLRLAARPFSLALGAAGKLGARTLAAALGRTSVMVAALSTATAMMVSVGIMVGSFRETVVLWMDNQLRADLYVRAAGRSAPSESPTIGEEVARRIADLPGVAAVDRFRSYPITYGGLPASLAWGDVRIHGRRSGVRFLHGADPESVWSQLVAGDSLIASEPFSQKHGVRVGDRLRLPVGERIVDFAVAGIFYDYSGEQGILIGDRSVLLRYLPDPRATSLAVYLERDAEEEAVRSEIVRAVAGRRLAVARNRQLRERAIEVFDRTFAITYALEAVAVAVAILGLAGALLTLVIDRRAELAGAAGHRSVPGPDPAAGPG